MPLKFVPAEFLLQRSVTIVHAYKDECEDVPLENWYSTNADALPGTEFEFDVRELHKYCLTPAMKYLKDHTAIIRAAIDVGILQQNLPPLVALDE